MKKRFIVLIDFSDHSKQLLPFVYAWAKKINAELILVHQVIKAIPGLGDSEALSNLKEDGKQSALKDLKIFAEEVLGQDPSIHFLADTSHLISMIESLEVPEVIDYLFVGMNDKSVVDRLFLGSTASELSKQLNKIIFAFPAMNTDINMDTLYVGIKEKYQLNEDAFHNLMAIMPGIVKQIHFFSALKPRESSEKTEEYLQLLRKQYNALFDTSYALFKNEEPITAVKDYMMANKGFLVIQKGSRALLDIFRKFWTTEMINMARIPIIILPNDTDRD